MLIFTIRIYITLLLGTVVIFGFWLREFKEMIHLIGVGCVAMGICILLSLPVDVKEIPVEAVVQEVEVSYDNSEGNSNYKTILSYNGDKYICKDIETYENCSGKKGTKVKANLVKKVYLTGGVDYKMYVG